MTDVAISYASSRRLEALDVATRLRAAGRSVWMDDQSEADTSLSSIGVPVGLPHWSVISKAIDDAIVLLVLDSPEWRASSYCWDEHAHAMERGKRIAVVELEPADLAGAPAATWPVAGIEGPGGLLERFDDDLDVVLAHDRLLQASMAADRRTRRSSARLLGDVRAVEHASPSAGVTVTEPMAEFAATVVEAARRRRATRAAMTTALVVAVVVLTAVALVARSAGLDDRRAAEGDAARQESLALSSDARRAETTPDQQRLADAALKRARTTEAVAAERSVSSASAGLRRFRHPLGPAYTVEITDGGDTVVLGTGDSQVGQGLSRMDLATGEVSRRILVQSSAVPWMTDIAPDGSWAVFASPSRSDLSVVSLDTAKQDHLLSEFSAFTVAADGSLWWAEPDGSIHRMADVARPDERQDIGRVDGHVTALVIDDDGAGLAAMLDGDAALRLAVTTSSGTSRLDVVDRFSLFPDVPRGYGADDGDAEFAPDLLLQCGSSLVAYRGSTWSAVTTGGIERDEYRNPKTFASSSWAPGPGCVGDAAVSIMLRPPAQTAPEGVPVPVGLERDADGTGMYPFGSDRSGEHLVVARASGIVDVFTLAAQPSEEPWGDAVLTVPLSGGEVVVTKDDEIWWRDSDRRRKKVGELPSSPQISIGLGIPVGDRGVLGTDDGIVVVDRTGVLSSRALAVAPTAAVSDGDGVIVAAGQDLVTITDLNDLERARTVTVGSLEDHEAIWGVATTGGDVVYITTSIGRVLRIDLADGSLEDEADVGPGLSPVGIVATTTGGSPRIVTYGADGIVRSFDRSLQLVDAAAQPGTGQYLALAPDGSRVLAGTEDGRLFLLDPETLQEEQPLTDGVLLPWGYRFSADGSRVVGVRVLRTGADGEGEITWRSRIQEFPLRTS
jgi:hypothetical protein